MDCLHVFNNSVGLVHLTGVHQFNVVMAISWSLVLLSAGGIPPLSGFLGK